MNKFFQKTLSDNSFQLFYKLNQAILLVYKNFESFFQLFHYFFYYIANFFSNCHIFIKRIFIFYHQINTFSLIRISFKYTYFWKEYA